jgi:hypothetical protein
MSDKINDGGPAFPCETYNGHALPGIGMTLRDWFAGQAPPMPQWFKSHYEYINQRNVTPWQCIYNDYVAKSDVSYNLKMLTAWAYEYADAMIAARNE